MSEPIPLRDEHPRAALEKGRDREAERAGRSEKVTTTVRARPGQARPGRPGRPDQAWAWASVCLPEEARSQLRVLCFRIQFVVIPAPPASQPALVCSSRPGSFLLVFALLSLRHPPQLLFPLSQQRPVCTSVRPLVVAAIDSTPGDAARDAARTPRVCRLDHATLV